MSLHSKNNRIISLVMALIMLIGAFSAISVSASDDKAETEVGILSDGIYRIKNKSTGKYLDSYDFKYDYAGKAYLDVATGQNGQDFRLERQENGSYVIYVLSESVTCALAYSQDGLLKKAKKVDKNASFKIDSADDGAYIISTAESKYPLVLSISVKRSDYGHSLLNFTEYSDNESQHWEFVKAAPSSISIYESSVRVRPYSVGSLTAKVTPSYIKDEIEWKSSDESIVMIDNDGTYCALKEGTATITAICGSVSTTCKITVSSVIAHSWFSQHNIYSGGWDALSLRNVYFYAGGKYKPYIIDKYNSNYDWMDEGCLISCIAMLLRNMGATVDGIYDIRNGKSEGLLADPYTVSLANAGSNGVVANNKTMYGNPIYVASNRIANSFKVNGKGFTVDTTYYVTKKAIKEALDRHPEGVIVGFKKPGMSHYILFTKCINPDEKNPEKYQFIVCDPAAYYASNGSHVLFEKSYSYLTIGYRYYNATTIEEWNLKK